MSPFALHDSVFALCFVALFSLLLFLSLPAQIAAEGKALCEIGRTWTAAGVKIRWNGYDGQRYTERTTDVFSSYLEYQPGNWRPGFLAANSTCFYNASLPLHVPEWCSDGWNGMQCDGDYKVIGLNIGAFSWAKTSHIPTAIGVFTNLLYLQLPRMGLTGSIPSFSRLSKLSYVDLSNNMLTGEVPAWVDKTMSNGYVTLTTNCNLTSTIPGIMDRIRNQWYQGKCPGERGEPVTFCLDCLYARPFSLSHLFAHCLVTVVVFLLSHACQPKSQRRVKPCVRSVAP